MTDFINLRREDVARILAYKGYVHPGADADNAAFARLSAALSAPPSAEAVVIKQGGDIYHAIQLYILDHWDDPKSSRAYPGYPGQLDRRAILPFLPSGEAVGLEWSGNWLTFNGRNIGVVCDRRAQIQDDPIWVAMLTEESLGAYTTKDEAKAALESAARAWLSPSLSETTKDHNGDVNELVASPQVQQPEGVPEGWKLVPIRPTEEMKVAVRENGGNQAVAYALAAWPDMLAAATEQGGE